jgi:hypothetical protein
MQLSRLSPVGNLVGMDTKFPQNVDGDPLYVDDILAGSGGKRRSALRDRVVALALDVLTGLGAALLTLAVIRLVS